MDQTGAWPRASWLSRVRLPWRLGILLALLSFLVLHSMAALPLPASRGVDNLSSYLIAQLFGGLASWLQYVLPLFMLALTAFTFWRERRLGLNAQATNPTLHALEGIGWEEFELLIAAAFQKLGYTVRSRGGRNSEGGVDVVLTKGREVFLVQGRQWRKAVVGVESLRELYAVMAAARAAGGFVLSAGQFSREAQSFAQASGIQLIAGPDLLGLIRGLDNTTCMPSRLPPFKRASSRATERG